MKRLDDLTEAEVLALAISNEEEDGRIYADFAHAMRADYPDNRPHVRRHGGGGERAPPPAHRRLRAPVR